MSDGFRHKMDHIAHDQIKVNATNQQAGNRRIPDLRRLITLKSSRSGQWCTWGRSLTATRGARLSYKRDLRAVSNAINATLLLRRNAVRRCCEMGDLDRGIGRPRGAGVF